jgi:cation transport ATPase
LSLSQLPNIDFNFVKQDQKAKDLLIQIASTAEQHSEHPLAKAIIETAKSRGIIVPIISGSKKIQAFIGNGVQCEG